MKIKIITIILITIIFPNKIFANTKFFQQGLDLYNEKKYNEAKFKFEQDLVINPKSEMSYLYLSKIFKNLDKKNLEEQNLNSVILLNPKNEEATFNLAKLKLNDVVSISFDSLDSKGSAILPLLIFLRRQERELSAAVTFKCCSAKVYEMARLAGLSEELGV